MGCKSPYTSQVEHSEEWKRSNSPMEKLAFVLVMAVRKLKPYFQPHTMIVLTDKTLTKK